MAPLALPHCLGRPYWHHQLVLSCYPHQPESHQLSLKIVLQFQRSGPIDRTPGTPGSDKKKIEVNTTLHPNHPLKICGIWPTSVVFDSKSVVFDSNTTSWPNSHRFWKICENLAQIPQILNGNFGWRVVLIANTLLRRVEFGIWLSNTTENLKSHSASPREISNFSVVFEPNSKFHSPQKRVCTNKNFWQPNGLVYTQIPSIKLKLSFAQLYVV